MSRFLHEYELPSLKIPRVVGLSHQAMDPNFTITRVNLATLQIARNRFEEAQTQLTNQSVLSLAALEKEEVDSAQLTLSEHERLKEAILQLTVA